jgi:hypothetical protein
MQVERLQDGSARSAAPKNSGFNSRGVGPLAVPARWKVWNLWAERKQHADTAGSGWTSVAAAGINASGQICGLGQMTDGTLHAVLLNPN